MKCAFIIPHGRQAAFVAPIVAGFEGNGWTVACLEPDEAWELTGVDLLVTFGPMYPITRIIERLRSLHSAPPLFFWYTEQTPPPGLPQPVTNGLAGARFALQGFIERTDALAPLSGRAGRLRALGELCALQGAGRLALAATFTETNRRALTAFGLPCVTVPLGYHPSFGRRLDLPRDVDVVFLGTTRDRRRRRIIDGLTAELARRGISFIVKDGTPERGYLFGQERTLLLNRTRIALNIMRQPWDDPVYRLTVAGACGAMLLSEPVLPTSWGPFTPGEHFATAPLAELPDAIEGWLADDAARHSMAERTHGFIMAELPVEKMVGRVLAELRQKSDFFKKSDFFAGGDLRSASSGRIFGCRTLD